MYWEEATVLLLSYVTPFVAWSIWHTGNMLARSGSIVVFLPRCAIHQERGEEPKKPFSGKFVLRVSEELHRNIAIAAASEGKSLNGWARETLEKAVEAAVRLLVSIFIARKVIFRYLQLADGATQRLRAAKPGCQPGTWVETGSLVRFWRSEVRGRAFVIAAAHPERRKHYGTSRTDVGRLG